MRLYCVAQKEELVAEVVAELVAAEVAGRRQNLDGEPFWLAQFVEK